MNDGNDDQNNSEIQKIEDLKEFLTNVCESMCLDALETKPKDIPNYMINFLQNRYGYSSSGLNFRYASYNRNAAERSPCPCP